MFYYTGSDWDVRHSRVDAREICPKINFDRIEEFDEKKNQVTVTTDGDPTSEDLLDLAVVATVKNGGRVYAVKNERMPEEHAAVAAILRY